MDLRQLNEIESSLDRLIDSLLPVVASIVWIVSIRLINRWLPKDRDKDDDEDLPDLPAD